jgi:hypothetical protein
MKCPAELYTAAARSYYGQPELTYPFHDRDVLITACGRLCLHRKKIDVSTVLARQKLGIKEVHEGIWLTQHSDSGPVAGIAGRTTSNRLLKSLRALARSPATRA